MPKKTITIADIVRVFGECELQDERGIFVPISNDYIKNKFDIDLEFGKIWEKKVEQMFEGDGKIEVKTERDIWKRTGNIAVEIRCRGKLSGISTTDAKTWIHMLKDGGGGFIFPVDELREKIKQRQKDGTLKLVMGGDDNAAQLALLPIRELFS
tara:strand:- start:2709 stop:3170 length:462 start_codon:yes stop_codon:yes gene_type:complete